VVRELRLAFQALERGKPGRTERQPKSAASRTANRSDSRGFCKGSIGCYRYPRYPQANHLIFRFCDSEQMCKVTWWSGRRSRPPQAAGNGKKGAAGTKDPISAGRQCQSSFGSGSGASREEAPEEMSSCRATRFLRFLVDRGEQSGTR